jgi:activating signal cointegrator 1
MKALTLWQPWASLMAAGHKKVETRTWATKYRGLVAIHAALKKPSFLGWSCESNEFLEQLRQLGIDQSALPVGCVLCIAKLVAISETSEVYDDLSGRERIFGNYEEGRYAWFFEDVKAFPAPVPAKGNRMLWNWQR